MWAHNRYCILCVFCVGSVCMQVCLFMFEGITAWWGAQSSVYRGGVMSGFDGSLTPQASS